MESPHPERGRHPKDDLSLFYSARSECFPQRKHSRDVTQNEVHNAEKTIECDDLYANPLSSGPGVPESIWFDKRQSRWQSNLAGDFAMSQ